MEFRIVPYLVRLILEQPEGTEDVVRDIDVAEGLQGLEDLMINLGDEDWLTALTAFMQDLMGTEAVTKSMAVQLQGAIQTGYEEFKKKAPQELVSHLDITSTRTNSIPLPPEPSLNTSPDLGPSESSNSDK